MKIGPSTNIIQFKAYRNKSEYLAFTTSGSKRNNGTEIVASQRLCVIRCFVDPAFFNRTKLVAPISLNSLLPKQKSYFRELLKAKDHNNYFATKTLRRKMAEFKTSDHTIWQKSSTLFLLKVVEGSRKQTLGPPRPWLQNDHRGAQIARRPLKGVLDEYLSLGECIAQRCFSPSCPRFEPFCRVLERGTKVNKT